MGVESEDPHPVAVTVYVLRDWDVNYVREKVQEVRGTDLTWNCPCSVGAMADDRREKLGPP